MIEILESDDERISAINENLFHPTVIMNHIVNQFGSVMLDLKDTIKKRRMAVCITTNYKGISTGKKSLYIWNGVYYQFCDPKVFEGIVRETYLELTWGYDTAFGVEVYNQCTAKYALNHEEKMKVNNYPNIIPFQNGYYERTGAILLPPNSKMYFTGVLKVDLADNAECPEFMEMMNMILPDRKYQDKVFSFMCLSMSSEFTKLTQEWVGDGDNGKSELAKFFLLVMPEFTSLVPFSVLMEGKDMEAISEIGDAWLNLGSEIHPKALTAKGIETFKNITGESMIRVRKLYEAGYKVPPKAKHLLIMNETPLPKAYCDKAFWNRLQVIPFTHPIPIDKQEDRVMERIVSSEGGMICRMLLSYEPHLKHHLRKDPREAERLWMWHTHSIFLFYEKFCEDGESYADDFYQAYCSFCQIYERKEESLTMFTRLMKSMGVRKERVWNDDDKISLYQYNAQLKNMTIEIGLKNQDRKLLNKEFEKTLEMEIIDK